MNTISGQKFRQMLVAGANALEANKKMVDEMNVFPVPDGDTGTNMSLTVNSAVKEVIFRRTAWRTRKLRRYCISVVPWSGKGLERL